MSIRTDIEEIFRDAVSLGFGTHIQWSPSDFPQLGPFELAAVKSGSAMYESLANGTWEDNGDFSCVVLQSEVETKSPNRIPKNGDMITDIAGNEFELTRPKLSENVPLWRLVGKAMN